MGNQVVTGRRRVEGNENLKRILLPLVVVGFAAWTASSAVAGTASLTCTSFLSGTVNSNVVVPAGAVCGIGDNAAINGNVSVATDARLFVGTGVTINGNLDATTGAGVLLNGATLTGSYNAFHASSAILDSSLYGKNVSFTGGSYGLLGQVTKNLACGGGTSGATTATTVAGNNAGCVVADLPTVFGSLTTAADNASGQSGDEKKPTECETATLVGNFYITTGNAMKTSTDLGTQLQGQQFVDTGNAIIASACNIP
jgi:hypothetical protein